MIDLRGYQQQALTDVRGAYGAGARAVLLVMPTGAGKTVLFVFVAARASERGRRTLILVHRSELLTQTSRTLERFGVRHGLIARGQPWTDALVQVASVQTLVRRLGRLGRPGQRWAPDLIIIDEAHHATAGSSWGRCLAAWPGARLLGVTATPERLDGQGLGVGVGGFFDHLVLGPQTAELVRGGWLSRPVVFAPASADMAGVAMRGGDFDLRGAAAAASKPAITGDVLAHWRRHAHETPSIAFCSTVQHAEDTAALFRGAGYRAASIDGTLGEHERRVRVADLANGQLHVLTSCEIISEGTDIPVVGAAILLRPTASLGLYLQQVGRALRPYRGKRAAVILDHVGNVYRHGLPDEDRDWSLGQVKRAKRARDEGDQARAPRRVRCPRCSAEHMPAPACPNCGLAYPEQRAIAFRPGELRQINPAEIRANIRRYRGRARSLADLEEVARAAGYQPGWARWVWESRQRRGMAA